jgi:hypothetical protein
MARSFPVVDSASEVPSTGSLGLAGLAAGVAGGLLMAAFLVVAAVTQGLEPFAAIEPMGATFRSADGFEGGPSAALVGFVLHLGVSALVGLVFATLMPRDFKPREAGVLCVGLAFLVMGVQTSVVVPAVNPVLKSHFHHLGGSWVIAHALFGLTSGYVCQRLRRALETRARRYDQRAAA